MNLGQKIIEAIIKKQVKEKEYEKSEAESLTREQILSEMDPETVQLMAAMPNSMMDSIWKALGVEK